MWACLHSVGVLLALDRALYAQRLAYRGEAAPSAQQSLAQFAAAQAQAAAIAHSPLLASSCGGQDPQRVSYLSPLWPLPCPRAEA